MNYPDMRLLQLLARTFPNSESASTEIINLEAILSLPKGTEHFVADIHGEHEAFLHILRNASGNIKRKVHDLFDESLPEQEMRDLCTLIYYPEKRLEMIEEGTDEDLSGFYARTLLQLIQVCQSVSSKYTRSKVRKALPKQFAYIIEELLHESPNDEDKDAYVQRIVETIVQIGQARNFIVAICNVIHKLSIDQLHILGDIFDRGPGAHIIMDYLLTRDNFDLQWGNHDALWMGAAAGQDACIAIVLRLSLRFANLATLEEGYGINLLPLATFAMDTYADDPCLQFQPIGTLAEVKGDEKRLRLIAQMHKAISVIQFKLEGQLINAHPEWNIDRRGTLENIDLSRGTYRFEVKTTDENGLWSDQVATLTIRRQPAPYETWWAYTLYLLLLLGAAYYLYQMVHNRIRLRHELDMRQLEQAKSEAAVRSKAYYAVNLSEERIIGTAANIVTGVDFCTSLANKNVTCFNVFTAEFFNA